MQTKLILLLSLSLTLGAGAAAAVPSECDNVLLTKNISRARQSNQVFSAWLSLIDVSNYGKIKQDASADVPVYFSGDYQSFDEKRRRYLNQQASTFTSSNARETLSSSLPEQAIPAWRACVASHSSGLFAYPVRGTRKSVDVVVGWRHPPGLANPGKLEVAVNGRTLDAAFPSNFEGEKTIAVPRDGEEIVGNVNATVGGASYTAAFHVPSYVAPKPPRLCGSGSRRIEAKNGDGAAAQLLIPPSDCDRQIRVGGVAGAVYETPGDPWVKVSMDTGDGTAPAQAQNGVAASGITYASVTRELFLRAGEERRITVKHENFRARAAETSAWAEVPTP